MEIIISCRIGTYFGYTHFLCMAWSVAFGFAQGEAGKCWEPSGADVSYSLNSLKEVI